MRVLEVRTLPNGEEEFDIELSDEERETIKKTKNWKRLTNKRIKEWFLETLKNTLEHEERKE